MKHKLYIVPFLFIGILFSNCTTTESEVTKFPGINFLDKKEGILILNQEDDYTKSWSQFDINSRLNKQNGTKTELFKHISSCIQSWDSTEVSLVLEVIDHIDSIFIAEDFKLPFPEEINFIKSTLEEEGGAQGYTRGNSIILNQEQLTAANKSSLKHLVVHEIFHVLSRNDAEFKRNLYSKIGFKVIEPVEYPALIADLKITNPDAPLSDAYLQVETDEGPINVLMILYSDEPYTTGSFFDYLNIGFLRLNENNEVFNETGNPNIYALKDIDNFFPQIGRNTMYIIHPEEILADNFAFMITGKPNLPDAWLTDAIKEYLKQ